MYGERYREPERNIPAICSLSLFSSLLIATRAQSSASRTQRRKRSSLPLREQERGGRAEGKIQIVLYFLAGQRLRWTDKSAVDTRTRYDIFI